MREKVAQGLADVNEEGGARGTDVGPEVSGGEFDGHAEGVADGKSLERGQAACEVVVGHAIVAALVAGFDILKAVFALRRWFKLGMGLLLFALGGGRGDPTAVEDA